MDVDPDIEPVRRDVSRLTWCLAADEQNQLTCFE